jgi:hypothetical protein
MTRHTFLVIIVVLCGAAGLARAEAINFQRVQQQWGGQQGCSIVTPA